MVCVKATPNHFNDDSKPPKEIKPLQEIQTHTYTSEIGQKRYPNSQLKHSHKQDKQRSSSENVMEIISIKLTENRKRILSFRTVSDEMTNTVFLKVHHSVDLDGRSRILTVCRACRDTPNGAKKGKIYVLSSYEVRKNLWQAQNKTLWAYVGDGKWKFRSQN